MKKEYLDNYDFFKNLPYAKLPKNFFEKNINLLKKLSFKEIKIIMVIMIYVLIIQIL